MIPNKCCSTTSHLKGLEKNKKKKKPKNHRSKDLTKIRKEINTTEKKMLNFIRDY